MLLIPRSFNSRAREGRDSRHSRTVMPACAFQFTRPRGARRTRAASIDCAECFNSRAREGRDARELFLLLCLCRFNSRAREGRDLSLFQMIVLDQWFQFTRPRGARPFCTHLRTSDISFNSRAREGRDYNHWLEDLTKSSFNSRAREGRDRRSLPWPKSCGRFQFTRPRGARQQPPGRARRLTPVSIHAPARGATLAVGGGRASVAGFNSRAREGRDRRPWTPTSVPSCFNSRAREGRDRTGINLRRPRKSFNSRAREGRDHGYLTGQRHFRVSIHAPARGATVVHLMLVFLCFFREVFAEPAANDVSWRLLSFRFR